MPIVQNSDLVQICSEAATQIMFGAEPTPSNKIRRGMPRPGVVAYAVMLAARVPGVDNEHKQKYIPLPCAHFAVLLACTDRFLPFPAQPATCGGSPGSSSVHLVSRCSSHGRHHHQASAHGHHGAVCGRRVVRPIPLCSPSACACCVRELICFHLQDGRCRAQRPSQGYQGA